VGRVDESPRFGNSREATATRPGIVIRRIEALGVSGAKGVADRADLKELLRLAADKAFDEIRVFSVDRLTRSDDVRERFAVYGAARDASARIVDCNGRVIDPGDDTGMGELDFYLQTMFAARERKKIVQRTAAGRKLKASQGKLAHGLPPYGRRFDRASNTWELVPVEVEIYRGIIDACLEGRMMLQIAKDLNARGVPSRRERWGYTSIRNLLTEPTIVGEYRSHGFTIQIPPICNRQTWEQVKSRLEQRRVKPPDTKARAALLRGLGRCASCGMPLWVLTTGEKRGRPRYGCPKPFNRTTPCPDRRTKRVDEVDALVRDAVLNLVRRRDLFERAVAAANGAEKSTPEKSAKVIEAEIVKLASKEAKTLKLFNEGFLTEDTAKSELAAIKRAREAAQAKRDVAPVAKVLPLRTLEATRVQLARALERVTFERLKELLSILRLDVKLGPNGLELSGFVPADETGVASGSENLAAWKTVSVPDAIPFLIRVPLEVPKSTLWQQHLPTHSRAQASGDDRPEREAATLRGQPRAPQGRRRRRA